jgi:hypothetical protein
VIGYILIVILNIKFIIIVRTFQNRLSQD